MYKLTILLLLVAVNAHAQFPTHTRPGEKDAMITTLANAKEDTFKVMMYRSLFYDYLTSKKEKRKYAEAMFTLSEKLNYKKGLAEAYNCLGQTDAHSLKHAGRIMDDYHMARYYFEQLGDVRGVGGVLSNMAKTLYFRSGHGGALDTLMRARQLLEGIGDTAYLPLVYYNIGSYYYRAHDYTKAIESYTAARKIFKTSQVQQGIAGCCWVMGLCYMKLEKYDDAIALAHASIDAAHKTVCEKCVQLGEKLLRRAEKKKG